MAAPPGFLAAGVRGGLGVLRRGAPVVYIRRRYRANRPKDASDAAALMRVLRESVAGGYSVRLSRFRLAAAIDDLHQDLDDFGIAFIVVQADAIGVTLADADIGISRR